MLQSIRDNMQGLIAKLFVGFIIAVFALFGVDTLVGTFLNATPELSVNGEEISSFEIDSLAQSKAREFYSQLDPEADFTDVDDTLFREQAINELIQLKLLQQSASNSGMAVSSAFLDRQILQTADFQVDGVYNNERATLLLQTMGHTPASYRALLARETLQNQLIAAYSASGFATAERLQQLVALVHQQRDFRYVSLSLDAAGSDIQISEDEIAEYYDNNQAVFMREEQVRIAYLELDRESLFDEVEVSEEDIRQAYQAEVAAYESQTERRAAHILFEAFDDAEYEAALAEAGMVKARLDAGEDFTALAAEFSDDLGSAEDGGDLGYTSGDSFVEEFEQALQNLQVGEVSEPVRTEFGYHLIKLTELNATEVPSYEEREEVLARDLKAQQVDELFLTRSEELSNLAFESFDLETPADIMGLEIQESDWFGRSGGTGVTNLQGVIAASFSLEVLEDGLNSELIRVSDDRNVVLHVLEHRLPEVRPLEEVRDEIALTLRLQRMREQARQIGETIAGSLRRGANIDSLLEAQGLEWVEVEEMKRDDLQINPAITEQVFSMPRPAAGETEIKEFALTSGEYIVAQLQAVRDGSEADLEAGELDNMRSFLSQQYAVLEFAGMITNMEARAEITGRQAQLDPENFDF